MSLRGYKKGKPALWFAAGIGIEAKPVVQPDKSIVFTKRVKRPPALWTQLPGAKVSVPKVKARVRPVSKKRQRTSREYAAKAASFVREAVKAGKTCPVFDAYAQLPPECQTFLRQPWDGKLRCTRLNEVHHTRGRSGSLLLDERWWLAVSRWGHRLIHAHPDIARKHGWLCEKGQWNETLRTM